MLKDKLIKNIANSVIILFFLFVNTASVAQSLTIDTIKLTLDQALEVALSENLTVQVANMEITKQEYAKKGTYSSLYPQLDFSGNYQRTLEKQTMYMDGIPGMESGIKVGRDNYWAGGFAAYAPLISVPLWKSLKTSALDVELAVEKARSSRIEMTDQVKRAFYGVLLARDAFDVFKQAYNNSMRNYKDIKQKYDHGLASEFDMIRAEVNVKNSEPALYDAENMLVLAHWQLKAIVGLNLESEIECVGTLSEYEKMLLTDREEDYIGLEDNSDLRQLIIQQKQLKLSKEAQLAQYYPSLNANFSYQWIAMNNDFKIGKYNWNPYSTVGLSLKIPIFSGGKRYSDVKKTEVTINQVGKQRENAERNLSLAVKQYVDQMNTCVKQHSAARAGVEVTEKGYAITMKRYETGEGTLLEINDSQLSMTQARLNLNQSIYNYMVAKSSLEKILGNSIEY